MSTYIRHVSRTIKRPIQIRQVVSHGGHLYLLDEHGRLYRGDGPGFEGPWKEIPAPSMDVAKLTTEYECSRCHRSDEGNPNPDRWSVDVTLDGCEPLCERCSVEVANEEFPVGKDMGHGVKVTGHRHHPAGMFICLDDGVHNAALEGLVRLRAEASRTPDEL